MGFVLPLWLPELVDQTQTVSSEEAKAMTRRLAREERIENLARLPGGEPRSIPAYNSCGLGMIGSERAGAEALRLLAPDFRAVKVRLGYPDVKTDVDVVRAVKRAVGDNIELMSDYNQSLTVAEPSSVPRRWQVRGCTGWKSRRSPMILQVTRRAARRPSFRQHASGKPVLVVWLAARSPVAGGPKISRPSQPPLLRAFPRAPAVRSA